MVVHFFATTFLAETDFMLGWVRPVKNYWATGRNWAVLGELNDVGEEKHICDDNTFIFFPRPVKKPLGDWAALGEITGRTPRRFYVKLMSTDANGSFFRRTHLRIFRRRLLVLSRHNFVALNV
jgi:hypothetical protein